MTDCRAISKRHSRQAKQANLLFEEGKIDEWETEFGFAHGDDE
jgi:hypothetical protein